jgi:hypothetical protein
MRSTYTIEFTPAGLDYVRRLLGTRPHDEARPLIDELEQQKTAQDNQPQQPHALPAAPPVQTNGSGEPVDATPH